MSARDCLAVALYYLTLLGFLQDYDFIGNFAIALLFRMLLSCGLFFRCASRVGGLTTQKCFDFCVHSWYIVDVGLVAVVRIGTHCVHGWNKLSVILFENESVHIELQAVMPESTVWRSAQRAPHVLSEILVSQSCVSLAVIFNAEELSSCAVAATALLPSQRRQMTRLKNRASSS